MTPKAQGRPAPADRADDLPRQASLLRALANEHRLRVLGHLLDTPEWSVGSLQARLDLSQSALSQHLGRLRDEGLVACRRDGQTVYYRLADPAAGAIVAILRRHGLGNELRPPAPASIATTSSASGRRASPRPAGND